MKLIINDSFPQCKLSFSIKNINIFGPQVFLYCCKPMLCCWYKIKIYVQMLALVYISQIVPYFSFSDIFIVWHRASPGLCSTHYTLQNQQPLIVSLDRTLHVVRGCEVWGVKVHQSSLHRDNQLDCVIIIVAERQAKYDHYSCYYFLWSSRTIVLMINEIPC